MSLKLYRSIENVVDGEIRYNIFRYPYCYQVVYEHTSVMMSFRSLELARGFSMIESERRAELIMNKLKG